MFGDRSPERRIVKKVVKPARKRQLVNYISSHYPLSERTTCRLVSISRRTYRYQRQENKDEALIEQINLLASLHPGYGFCKLYHKLRAAGFTWNHKRVYRVYTALKMNIRRRARKRLPKRIKQPLSIPNKSDRVWSMDFMQDSLWNGRRFRILNILDDHNREIIAMEIDCSISSKRVVRILERLKEQGRKPDTIRVDNGPEFVSNIFQLWCQENQASILYIQPGKPTQNSLIERFNGTYRKELLDMYVFRNLQEVEQLSLAWQQEYNYRRPHKSLNYLSPINYKKQNLLNLQW